MTITPEQRKAWEILVSSAEDSKISTKGVIFETYPEYESDRTILAIDAHLKELEKIAAKVEDVELIASEFVYKHTVSYLAPCKTRSLRWDELTEEQKEPYREDARAIRAWAKEG